MPESGERLKDKHLLLHVIFILHGIGVTMPWNMFLNANDYFLNYKFSTNYTGPSGAYYRQGFYKHLQPATMLPLLVFVWLNVFLATNDESIEAKVTVCMSVCILLILFTITLAMVDTSGWPNVFFALTMLTVICFNIVNGLYQGIVYGMASRLSWRYLGCLNWGSNLSGTLTTLVAIFASFIPVSSRTKAIYYFIMALVILLLCLNTYLALPLIKYYRNREYSRKQQLQSQRRSGQRAPPLSTVPFWSIFKEICPQLLNVFLIFAVTLSLFPSVQVRIRPVDEHFFLGPNMFMLVFGFLTFNFFAAVGCGLALCFRWPSRNRVVIPAAFRILYIPFYLFCNYRVRGVERKLPVLIANDWAYWAVATTMAFTSGYWSTVAIQYVPEYVASHYRFTAGCFVAAMLVTGLIVGVLMTYLWPIII